MNRADKEAADQIAGPCKVCKAEAGKPCVNHHGEPLGGVHAFGMRRQIDVDYRKMMNDRYRED